MSDALSFPERDGGGAFPRPGLAPLVDIVLLLICFYLLVARSIQSRTDEPIELPAIAAEHTREPGAAELVVNLLEDGSIQVNGVAADLETLRAALHAERARPAAGGIAPRVVVRADAGREYRALDEILAACRDAGFPSVALRTQPEAPR